MHHGSKILIFGLSLLLVPQAWSQAQVPVQLPKDGRYALWVGRGFPTEPPNVTFKEGKSQAISAEELLNSETVLAWDEATNNVAKIDKTALETRNAGWVVQPSDFKFVGAVKIRVEHAGKPVSVAQVTLNDGQREFKLLIDPATNGTASAFGVLPGDLKVFTTYRTGDASKTNRQTFELKLKRDTLLPTFIVSIPEDVATTEGTSPTKPEANAAADKPVGEGKGAEPTKGAKPAQVGVASTIGTIIVWLVGAGAGIALILYLLQLGQNKSQQLQQGLNRLGVPVPNPDPDPGAPSGFPSSPDPFGQAAPEPPQKIILGDADPVPLAQAPAVAPVAPISGSVPALSLANGQRLDLPEGESILGRDAGVTLSLTSESSLSRRHAALVRTGNQVILRDLGSTNGTYVNGAKITVDTPLTVGDKLQFGSVQATYVG